MTARMVQVERGLTQVYDGDPSDPLNYVGLIRKVGDRFRAHGTGLNLDLKVVSMESPIDFVSVDEALSWLFDEPGTEA